MKFENSEHEYFSEDPEFDIWSRLKNYSYAGFLDNYFSSKKLLFDDKLKEVISGSILQAKDYFEASRTVSMQTAPLLMYYGAVNLLYAASCLKSGKILEVKGHGMSLKKETIESKHLQDLEVNMHLDKGSGFMLYLEALENQKLSKGFSVSLDQILSSIPELYREYINISHPDKLHIMPLVKIITDDFEMYRSRIKASQYSETLGHILQSEAYNETFLAYDITIFDEIEYYLRIDSNQKISKSFLGEYYFQLEVPNIPILNPMFFGIVGLYLLATVSRYHTGIWSSFLKNNQNGWVNFIEKFLSVMRRYLPNYILDTLEEKKYKFTNRINPIEDQRNQLSDKNLEKQIMRIVNRMEG